jgi:chromosome segregation and condensation protein ScpB
MDETEQKEFLEAVLIEAVQELIVYRRLAEQLCAGPTGVAEALELLLSDLRGDDPTLREVRTAWRIYLEAHVEAGGLFPRTLLRNFVDEWKPTDLSEMN